MSFELQKSKSYRKHESDASLSWLLITTVKSKTLHHSSRCLLNMTPCLLLHQVISTTSASKQDTETKRPSVSQAVGAWTIKWFKSRWPSTIWAWPRARQLCDTPQYHVKMRIISTATLHAAAASYGDATAANPESGVSEAQIQMLWLLRREHVAGASEQEQTLDVPVCWIRR